MKNGWPTKTLGDLCQLISGQHIDAKDYNTESRGVGYLTGPSDFGLVNPVISKWTEHPKVGARKVASRQRAVTARATTPAAKRSAAGIRQIDGWWTDT